MCIVMKKFIDSRMLRQIKITRSDTVKLTFAMKSMRNAMRNINAASIIRELYTNRLRVPL